ncbi:RNA polymerase sigma-70 factor, ECF subfamily [Klenkia soli]|uniref:RNA polymerase sigma-70 factor, ECF subfamily n=1 Tax=Klenkia soli TaxID=1052260 RepID=A0A1H0C8V4_9ACTN|nr:sigma-70 family RNA polymerase sigma factor [Klenkia soli]SDN54330.1 RNA polymerase sigma-70 factor, ECF subfamily [Klenkia soli]
MPERGQPAPPRPTSTADRLEEAYRESGSAVLGYALRRCSSREDALDVVAETFAAAWRRQADLPADQADIRPWLFGIARLCLANTARTARRSDRLGRRLAEAFTHDVVPDPSDGHAGGTRVVQALAELSPDDRELVTLIAWEGLTPTEAAGVLGLPPGTARVRLHRARTRLRTVLSSPTTTESDS